MAGISSENRNFSLKTPLGEDVLIVESFSGKEEISRLFSYTIELESNDPNINYDDIVSENVTLSILLPDKSKRFINGHVNRFIQSTESSDMSIYQMEVVPWLWFLTQTTDCRIFQEKSVPDIIKQIFDDAGFSGKYEDSLSGSYDPREYCVQYRETDFNFVSRLMEEEGIFYFFKHQDGEHKLILGDDSSAHSPIEPAGDLEFFLGGEETTSQPAVTQLSCEQSVRPTAVSYKDYNFKKPSTDLMVKEENEEKHEIYDYPGNYKERAGGEHLVKVRLEEENATRKLFSGTSTDRRLSPGFTTKLINHPRDDFNATYLITSVYQNGSEDGEGTTYESSFELIPGDVPFRAEQITEKPVVTGLQTAVVTGPSGEEIWLDQYGRIKVQFHWDREGKNDEKSSCWIRVAQNWAGKNWGIVFHPRIGQEVIIQFKEGDIDHPLVTGRVYNEEQMPPYELPANSTQSTIKSRSSKGGDPANFNEIKFEDKKGEEHFLIHAEKDHGKIVENDESHSVGNDRTKSIGNDETNTIGNNQSISVGNDQSVSVDNNQTIAVTSNRDKTVSGNQSEGVTGNKTIKVGGNHSESISGNMTQSVSIAKAETITAAKALSIGAAYQVSVGAAMNETIGGLKAEEIGAVKTVNVGANSSENVGGGKSVNAGKDISENAGKNISSQAGQDLTGTSGKKMMFSAGDDFGIKGGKKGVIEIKDELTIKCGKATITLKKNGDITINGNKINIKGSGDIVMKGKKILQN